jgi:hypothetical protein
METIQKAFERISQKYEILQFHEGKLVTQGRKTGETKNSYSHLKRLFCV